MSLQKYDHIKKLHSKCVPNTPITSLYLKHLGISNQLQYKYVTSGWLERLGPGAFKFPKAQVTWEGAVFSLQQQLEKTIHLGGRSALEYYGMGHFLSLSVQKIFLFKPPLERLPTWFSEYAWDNVELVLISSSLFNSELGLEKETVGGFEMTASAPERAAFEVASLVGKHHSLDELVLLSENFSNFRPALMQGLFKACHSKTAKRVLLMLGRFHGHLWFNHLNLNAIDIGSGVIQLEGGGTYIKAVKLSIPKRLEDYTNV